jgi:menaquinone-dependent protoporphyrinogen oxidase
MKSELNRRDFLHASAAGVGLMALAPLCRAASAPLNGKILVAYASRCGSTADIARAVAEDLKRRAPAVDLRAADKVATLAGYEAVVLGSAVRFGHWLPEAVDFVRAHQAGLKRVPTAFFTVHIMNIGPTDAARKARLAYLDPVHAVMKPGAEVFFAGRMEQSRLSFTERLLCKVMKGHDTDLRDWPAIHAWGQSVFA